MPAVVEITNITEYVDAVNQKIESGERFIAYMTGSVIDGKCWCFYCDKFRDTINKNILNDTKLTVLKGLIPTKEEWVGVKTHPWKTHPLLKAKGAPGILLIEGHQVLIRADDDDEIENDEYLQLFNDEM